MKIKKEDLQKIIERLKNGESFTKIGKEYGVSAWTIQKRIGKHPLLSRNEEFKIWEFVPDFQNICFKISKKFWNIDKCDLLDELLDKSTLLNAKEQKYLSSHPFPNRALIRILTNFIFDTYKKRKKYQELKININNGFLINNFQ